MPAGLLTGAEALMRWILAASLRFRLLVVAAATALLLVGITQLRNASVDVLPEFAPPYIEVQTESLGLSASEVEELVTLNLEELLNGTPWLDEIRSTSVPGLSSIVLTFEPGTDVMRARQLVAERLTLAYALPNVSRPPVILQPRSATSRAMMIGLSSQTVSPIEMSVLTRWDIRPALLAVPGVANVAVWGNREQQLQVRVEPKRLAADHLSLDEIVRTTGNAMWVSPLTFLEASTPGTGGWIDAPQQRLEVRHVFPITGPAGLSKVRVEDAKQRLGNVTEVVEDHQPLIGDAVLQDGPGLLLVVEKFPNANTLEVTRGVEQTLDRLAPGLPGIAIDTSVFRPANYIDQSIDNLKRALLIGAILVLLVLLAFFYDWRGALIALMVVPVSVTTAALVLYLRGSTINTMVLAGLVIALGVIVDDAVSDVERIRARLRRQREEKDDRPASEVVLEAALDMRRVVFYGTLIVALPLLPVFFMRGVSGALFEPLALSYVVAVFASMMVALTLTPALSLILLPGSALERRESPLLRWLRRGYTALLARIVVRPVLTLVAAGITMVAAIAVSPLLGQSLLPGFKEPDLVVQWDGPPGTSQPEMTRITTRAVDELRSLPGVSNVAAHVGRAILGDQVVDINSGELWVSIDPSADYDSTVAGVQRTVAGYPGLVHHVQTYLGERVNRVLSGADDAVVVRIFGPRFDVLRAKAAEVSRALADVDGVSDVNPERQVEQPTLQIEVNLAKARRYGLKPGDVRREASTLLSSLEVGSLFQEQKVFQVVVWSPPEDRSSLTDIQNLLIDTPSGGHVRLGDVADLQLTPTPNVIHRETVSRRLDVGLTVDGRDLGAVVDDVHSRLADIDFPLEYHAEVLGEYSERQNAFERMIGAGVAAAIGILLLLQAVFQSWRLAALSFLTLPFALAGGVVAAFLNGGDVSLASLVGFLAVFGIAARNSILLLHGYQELQHAESGTGGADLVLRGAQERLAPTLMTALAVGLALLPLVILGSIPGQEIAHPVAVIILGGLVTSTLLNLLVLPVVYLRFGFTATSGVGSAGKPAPATREV